MCTRKSAGGNGQRMMRMRRLKIEDFGAGTDFEKVLNPNDGIHVNFTNPLCPQFEFEEKERERLMKPFRRTLIVKLMGRQLSYGFMVKRLRMLWARKGDIDIFDMDNEFYLVNFQQHEDYMEALIGGPLVIADAYLNVARWRPNFDPKKATIDLVVAWVRLPDLPAPLFDKKFLLNLGNAIGKAISLDIHTAQRARGKFTRMCVELDLTKPLIPEFNVEGQILSVVYESLGVLCQQCGRVGHKKEECEAFQQRNKTGDMEVEISEECKAAENVQEDSGGRWKTVSRARKVRPFGPVLEKQQGGSRFNVLREHPEIVEQSQGEEMKQNKEEITITQGILKKGDIANNQSGGSQRYQKKFEVGVTGERASTKERLLILWEWEGECKTGRYWARLGEFLGEAEVTRWLLVERNQGIRVTGKENLNPGDCNIKGQIQQAMMMEENSAIEEGDARLQGLAADVVEPWMVAGDFNEIKSLLEQKGGGRVNEARCSRFSEWIQNCGLVDVKAKGPFYTCEGPKWEGLDRVYKRLDRCLCNVSWLEKFQNAETRILPRVCSDHHPLFINLLESARNTEGRRFRFEAMWKMHEHFNEVVQQSWKGEEEVHMKLETLQKDLVVWNKEVFGQVEGRKRRLLNRLNGIQCSPVRNSYGQRL
ncbi:hypothetical protein K1719_045574 [Acacia pycnantha]|nr:hypothetical protein K1719_045574 [Acacia pycnantha]